MRQGKMRVEMHVHTCFSPDSFMSLQQLADACSRKQIDCVAITDHNTISGAVAFQRHFTAVRTIIGEEISTSEGEIIGYFLQQEIKPGQSVAATIAAIKEQGGLACVPHPFDRHRSGVLKPAALMNYLDQIDLIERYNSRNLNQAANRQAECFAEQYGKISTVGADAHWHQELGRCQVLMDDFQHAADFLVGLAAAQTVTAALPWWRNVLYSGARLIKRAVMPSLCPNCSACTGSRHSLQQQSKTNFSH